MRMLRLIIAGVLLGGSLGYVVFGEHKEIGIIAGIAALIACRYLIPDLRSPAAKDEPD